MVGFGLAFLIVPISMVLLVPYVWLKVPRLAACFAILLVCSMALPQREWTIMRKVGQLWYEVLQFSCNLSPEEALARITEGDTSQFIIGMHPHGKSTSMTYEFICCLNLPFIVFLGVGY